jgi:hypothetical protein
MKASKNEMMKITVARRGGKEKITCMRKTRQEHKIMEETLLKRNILETNV